ncbi:Hsp70 family protein [Solwaraspora sp. WMMD792]|uniref:Hsp70 family protein n=1 Tax=Solwaraspora sp. WMMD792 TaxID=3016099 RepID=UPI00241732FB|nr:Hsp70 family protein [Solwaraspora sp. WMMD792]MDG4772185.1 Hsp70 family protein [Solwaraspora sp. WMMD792]
MGTSPAGSGEVHLGVDIGTYNTAAALRGRDGRVQPVLFDGAPLLPSAVFVDGDTTLVGPDAWHAAMTRPAQLEPNPKRCIDDRYVLLGAQEVPVETLLAALLRRVRVAAEQAAGRVDAVTIAYPVAWGQRRLATLTAAARLAGLPEPATVHEPVAAAAHFVGLPDVRLAEGQLALVYDLGAGTFDATVIRRSAAGFEVIASQGLSDAGGLYIDEAVAASISANLRPDDAAWRCLRSPSTPTELRARRMFLDGVRVAKQVLSRAAATSVHVPMLETEVPLGREQFETLARPVLDRTIAASRATLRDAQLAESDLAEIFLVGGSTRIPLVGTLLHQAYGRPPVVLDQPELAVAYGSVAAPPRPVSPPPAVSPVPAVNPPPAVSPPLVGRSLSVRGTRRMLAVAVTVVLAVTAGVGYLVMEQRDDDPDGGSPQTGQDQTRQPSTDPSESASPLAVALPTPTGVPTSFAGQWSGIVDQPTGTVTSWSLTATFAAGADGGTFRSTSLGCEGTLTIIEPRPTSREIHLRQRTTVNSRSLCVGAAQWTLILQEPDRADMHWVDAGSPSNTGTATFVRS